MRRKRAASLILAGALALLSVLNVRGNVRAEELTAGGLSGTKEPGADLHTGSEEKRNGAEADSTAETPETQGDITSIEDANAALDSYADENAEWEEISIDSAEDLKAFARNCWLDTWSVNKKVYLREDIDLSGSDFVPIPTFGGYFDGQGHKISGFAVRDAVSYTGLFCYTQQTAVITNLTVQGNVHPSGRPMVVGGIVGDNRGIVTGCTFEGRVEGADYVGGITGFNEISGILIDCNVKGKVNGTHYTGGIAGENTGNIAGCTNEADINVSNEDRAKSLEDINAGLEQYTSGLLEPESGGKEKKAPVVSNTIDAGGIAGLSTGIIQFCGNSGTVGYEHVGYNMGGIVGRQSGYVYSCENTGTVYGRKDVGGIAGQTEPYIAVDLSEDIAYKLSENIDKLHDLTGKMLDDAGAESDTVSARLTVIRGFVDKALQDTGFLADRTVEWTDGMIGSANDLMGRVDYIMDESAKNGGVLDQTKNAAGDVRDAAGQLKDTVDALDLYRYMSEEEKARYEEARAALENAAAQYAEDYDAALRAYKNYYIDKVRSDPAYGYARSEGFMLYVNTGEPGDAADNSNTDIDNASGEESGSADKAPGEESGSAGKAPGEEGGSDNNASGEENGSAGKAPGEESGSAGSAPGEEGGSDNNAPGEENGSADNASGEEGGSADNAPGEKDGPDSDAAAEEDSPASGESAAGSPDDPEDHPDDSNQTTTGAASVQDLRPCFGDSGVCADWTWKAGNTYREYLGVTGWVHYTVGADGEARQTAFPQSEGEQGELDKRLLADVAKEMAQAANASKIEADAAAYAKERYLAAHPDSPGYQKDMEAWLRTISDIVFKYAEKMSEEARANLRESVASVEDAMEDLQSAGTSAQDIFHTINGMPDLQLPQLGSDYRSMVGSLNANLQGLSENMGHLNEEMSSTNDVMLADLSKINDQFSMIMRLYTDAIDGVLDMDYSTVYEDNSEEDAESSTDATIADCTNRGAVRGDLDVSGIAGTMAIEYDFDLEGDVTGIENARLNSTFLTKCVLRHNVNEGNITAQKSYAGGIAGLQEMGTILGCENYGRISSTAGNYVGGIAGQSLSNITDGYAKCTVSGEAYVAGIAGSGSGMVDCRAMVRVQDAVAFYGAIAGEADSTGTVTGNLFVSDEIAGIDRISYGGKAEPVSYEELLETENLPNRFHMMSVVFYADEEEVKRIECPYQSDVTADWYPEIPARDGFYADWDIREIPGILYDEDVTAEYVRYLTTLACAQTRENGQSVLLADGMFRQEAQLLVTGGKVGGSEAAATEENARMPAEKQDPDRKTDPVNVLLVGGITPEETETGKEQDTPENIPLKNVTEYWHITVPEDENERHQIRYQAPEGQIDNITLYVKQNGTWEQADTELMGMYHLFTIEGTEAEIAVCIQDKEIGGYLIWIIPIAAAGLIVLLYRRRKRRGGKRP